jgi:hypothetical protein
MTKVPTDLEILQRIYERHHVEFENMAIDRTGEPRSPFVPVDIRGIAKDLRTDPDIVFGRLYYYLDPKYARGDKRLFTIKANEKIDCVHFPFMVSVLAELQYDNRWRWRAITISIIAIVISGLSFLLALSSLLFSKR